MMVRLQRPEQAALNIVKEFVPTDHDVALSAGRLIVRANNYGSKLAGFDALFNVMAADAQLFEPPIELSREDVEVVYYGGQRYRNTFGLEAVIPEGHSIPVEYARMQWTEVRR